MPNPGIEWEELVRKLYETGGKKTYNTKSLAEIAATSEQLPFGMSEPDFVRAVGEYLARNARSKNPTFSKVKNKKGGFLQATYKIKPQKALDLTPQVIPQISSSFTGTAGEFAVMSELLFRGYNASKMTVDDGIDIVASKDDKFFHIQVKTANYHPDRPFQATIRENAFRHSYNVFYIIVLRAPTPMGFVNRYAIFPSSDIRRMIAQGTLKDTSSISIRISLVNQKFLLGGNVDVSHQINDFESIC